MDDVIFTENGVNDHGARYFMLDGKYYRNWEYSYVEIKEVLINNQKELFVAADSLSRIFSLDDGSYKITTYNDENPYLAGYISVPDAKSTNADGVKDYGNFTTRSFKEYISLTETHYWVTYNYDGKEITLPLDIEQKLHEAGVLYMVDGVRCFNTWYTTLVNVNDIFEKFGMDGSIFVNQIDDDTFAWGYER